MPGTFRERAPEEVLVERQRAAVRIPADEVDVQALQIVRPERDALDDARLEIRDVPSEPLLDAIGVALARVVVPVETARQLLQLDPQQALAIGSARRIDRQRLPD